MDLRLVLFSSGQHKGTFCSPRGRAAFRDILKKTSALPRSDSSSLINAPRRQGRPPLRTQMENGSSLQPRQRLLALRPLLRFESNSPGMCVCPLTLPVRLPRGGGGGVTEAPAVPPVAGSLSSAACDKRKLTPASRIVCNQREPAVYWPRPRNQGHPGRQRRKQRGHASVSQR